MDARQVVQGKAALQGVQTVGKGTTRALTAGSRIQRGCSEENTRTISRYGCALAARESKHAFLDDQLPMGNFGLLFNSDESQRVTRWHVCMYSVDETPSDKGGWLMQITDEKRGWDSMPGLPVCCGLGWLVCGLDGGLY